MKALRFILKLCGIALLVIGAVCVISGYSDKIRDLLPCRKRPSEFDDYADVNPD